MATVGCANINYTGPHSTKWLPLSVYDAINVLRKEVRRHLDWSRPTPLATLLMLYDHECQTIKAYQKCIKNVSKNTLHNTVQSIIEISELYNRKLDQHQTSWDWQTKLQITPQEPGSTGGQLAPQFACTSNVSGTCTFTKTVSLVASQPWVNFKMIHVDYYNLNTFITKSI